MGCTPCPSGSVCDGDTAKLTLILSELFQTKDLEYDPLWVCYLPMFAMIMILLVYTMLRTCLSYPRSVFICILGGFCNDLGRFLIDQEYDPLWVCYLPMFAMIMILLVYTMLRTCLSYPRSIFICILGGFCNDLGRFLID